MRIIDGDADIQKCEDLYALEAAASMGRESTVKLILGSSKSLHHYVSQFQARKALMEASMKEHVGVMELLLASDFDLYQQVRSALYTMAFRGKREVVEGFLSYIESHKPTQINYIYTKLAPISYLSIGIKQVSSPRSMIPFNFSSIANSIQAAVDEYDRSLQEVFLAGCSAGNGTIIALALDLMHVTSSLDREELLQRPNLAQALTLACEGGHLEALSTIMVLDDLGSFELQDYSNAVKEAAMKGHYEAVRFFDDRGRLHQGTGTFSDALIAAAGNGHTNIVRLLVMKMEGFEFYQETIDKALHVAAQNGWPDTVSYLILAEADVNALVEEISDYLEGWPPYLYSPPPKIKTSPLQVALRDSQLTNGRKRSWGSLKYTWREADIVGKEASIRLCLEKGANVKSFGGLSTYPLQTAMQSSTPTVVKWIIEFGGEIAVPDVEGGGHYGSAPQAAARVGNVDIVRRLLVSGR